MKQTTPKIFAFFILLCLCGNLKAQQPKYYNDIQKFKRLDSIKMPFLSSDNLTNYRKTMQNWILQGKELVVCTHGKRGATALTKRGQWIDEPSLSGFAIVDTNGAGDSFFAGFLYAYLKNESIENCMKYGALCGAYCITSKQLVYEELSETFLENEFKNHFLK